MQEIITFYTQHPYATAGVLFGLGALIGSFLNVVAYRLPRRLEWQWRTQARDFLELPHPAEDREPSNLFRPASACPACNTTIKPQHNIPIVGWAVLRGRCAACRAPISIQYPLVELATAILTALPVIVLGVTPYGVTLSLLSPLLVCAALVDARSTLLPDAITLTLLWLCLAASAFAFIPTEPSFAIVGAAVGYLTLAAPGALYRKLTGQDGMGGGDLKLMAAAGALLGPLQVLVALLIGSLTFTLAHLVLHRGGRREHHPFGPFLAAGIYVTALGLGQFISAFFIL